MSARDATIQSMGELQVALVAIALVLSAVFLPMAFFGGSTGVIYRQFSITIISAMALSVLVALILSPAITATVLKPKKTQAGEQGAGDDASQGRFAAIRPAMLRAQDWFNRNFDGLVTRYMGAVRKVVDRKWLFLAIYLCTVGVLVLLFLRLPGGFVPNEDQGRVQVQFRLPPGTTQTRTLQVRDAIYKYITDKEAANVDSIFLVAGGGGGGSAGQNTGQGFLNLKHWDKRTGAENSAQSISERASKALSGLRDAQVFTTVPGAIRGLGDSAGFSMQFRNTSGMSRAKFVEYRELLLARANANPKLAQVRLSDLPDVATLKIDLDTQRLSSYGLRVADVNATLAAAWGGRYVNDFIDKGRVKRVYVQGDARFRAAPEDLSQWYVRSSTGAMAPFSAFSTISWATAPSTTSRFQGVPSFGISGQAAPGVSSGEAMAEIERLASAFPGTGVAWSGSSYEERQSSGQAPLLYGLSLLVVFLCLAALYESWSIPLAVLLVIPIGLVGAVFAATLRGLENDVYLQIGLLTTMGLAAKNSILMIEFAEQEEKKGARVIDAVVAAARIRLRPILMTSFAFIFGVLPLALATGAGANSRIAIGTSVIGGMLAASMLAIFYIPLLFVLVRRGTRDGLRALHDRFGRKPQGEGVA
jgi:multidrug efflux pump